MQDIVPKGRSIRNISPSPVRVKAVEKRDELDKQKALKRDIEMKEEAETKLEEDVKIEKEELENLEENSNQKDILRKARLEFEASRARHYRKPKLAGKKWLWISVAVIGIFIIAAGLGAAFHSATIVVTPKTLTATIASDLNATKSVVNGGLSYQLISIKQTGSETVSATGQKQVNTKASGTIVIYNNYSSASQRLITNTRFATPEGLIFRINSSVTVPGKSGSTPGSVEATVIADEAGANYNVGLKDFTIPGFKGDPRYAGFYARSKTPLSGGFSGMQKIVASADRIKAKNDIEAKLRDELVRQVSNQKSLDTVFFSNAYSIVYTALPDENTSDSQATIKEDGTIYATVFNRSQISTAIAKSSIKNYAGDPLVVDNLEGLVFQGTSFNPATSTAISFKLTGPAVFEWSYDESALKEALKGQSKSNISVLLQKFPMIEKANISIHPFWFSSFPGSVSKITIKKSS